MNRKEKYEFICEFYRENYTSLKFKLSTYALAGLANRMPLTRYALEGLADGKIANTKHVDEFRHLDNFRKLGVLEKQPVANPRKRRSPRPEFNEYVLGPDGFSLLEHLPKSGPKTKKQLINRYLEVRINHERATYSTLAILASVKLGAKTNKEISAKLGRSEASLAVTVSRGVLSHGYVELSKQDGPVKYWRVSRKGCKFLTSML